MKNLEHFFDFCKEREAIRIRKESGQPWPWTEVQALRDAFYCNVFREDDKVTRWFRVNVRDFVADDPYLSLQACVAFRWFNKIETGEVIRPWLLGERNLDSLLREVNKLKRAGKTVFGAAYIISSPLGDPKTDWAVKCSMKTMASAGEILADHRSSLEAMHARLMEEQGLGAFMAYEIVTDLRHTCVLRDAPDIMTWANPGPGCARGLGWVVYDYNKGMFSRSNKDDRAEMLDLMREILAASRSRPEWAERPWEMREVEHCLCEYDKFRRVQQGDKPKRRYR